MDFLSIANGSTRANRSTIPKMIALALRQGLMLAALAILLSNRADAQNKVDLEDMTIKGELVNDDRLRMSSRDSQTMKEKIGYRANFRKEIVDNKEVSWPETETASNPMTENRREPSSIAMPSMPSMPQSPSLPRVGSAAGALKKPVKSVGKP